MNEAPPKPAKKWSFVMGKPSISVRWDVHTLFRFSKLHIGCAVLITSVLWSSCLLKYPGSPGGYWLGTGEVTILFLGNAGRRWLKAYVDETQFCRWKGNWSRTVNMIWHVAIKFAAAVAVETRSCNFIYMPTLSWILYHIRFCYAGYPLVLYMSFVNVNACSICSMHQYAHTEFLSPQISTSAYGVRMDGQLKDGRASFYLHMSCRTHNKGQLGSISSNWD